MFRTVIRRGAVALIIWLPFFAVWTLMTMSFGHASLSAVLPGSLVAMGSAGLLGVAVWYACWKWPWPDRFRPSFYLLQIFFAAVYGVAWTLIIYLFDYLRSRGSRPVFWTWSTFSRELVMGIWLYAVIAGISHAMQTRNRLQEKETAAARAEALASAARLDAIRARLNPHFLFNALHTLAALVKFRPALAESAIERLGDMLRYALKEDGRGLVEFSEEYDFTRQYLAFEQLRYEERLRVNLEIDPQSFEFDLPPFSLQTLAENAVQHAIAIRPEGGTIWIRSCCADGRLQISVRDNGPGNGSDGGDSHQFGLRSLRERLQAAYGAEANVRIERNAEGFEAMFSIPVSVAEHSTRGAQSS